MALEAAHPLHRGPTDHKRSVGPLLSPPEVHNQLFSFAHIQRETVVLALHSKGGISLSTTSMQHPPGVACGNKVSCSKGLQYFCLMFS